MSAKIASAADVDAARRVDSHRVGVQGKAGLSARRRAGVREHRAIHEPQFGQSQLAD